ncbi:Transposase [Planctomycetes bacterium CA13]|uniref:Transposase n=2 Tax=Novipirellula herctigrandis TaxID=2527986 RepID=A0A5C5YY38_9BACT|nr:Transposase [Planctomycetes bacterium CA13]
MKLDNQQHPLYCGIDLRAKTLHVCVVDELGEKRLHRYFQCQHAERLFERLCEFQTQDIVIGCEPTFNWYWLADACDQHNFPFILGHALYLKAIHGGETKSDAIDSEKLARLIRGGNFPLSHVYPKAGRAARDLMRRSTHLVRRRAETLTHIQLLHLQPNLPKPQSPKPKNIKYKANRVGNGEGLSDPCNLLERESVAATDYSNRIE